MEDSGFACKAVTILIYKVIIACFFFNMQAFPKKYFYLFFTQLIHFKKSLLKVKKRLAFSYFLLVK